MSSEGKQQWAIIAVHVPLHHSYLVGEDDCFSERFMSEYDLILQCRTEGSFWRVLCPMLFGRFLSADNGESGVDSMTVANDAVPKMLITILIRNFLACMKERWVSEEAMGSKNHLSPQNFHQVRHQMLLPSSLKIKQAHIILLPPTPSPSGNFPLWPENTWTSALIRLENLRIRLTSLNAYVATLGGGYFLCRRLEIAISLAKRQRSIALALNDYTLAGQCSVNEAYNFIFAGKIDHALRLIRTVAEDAKARNDELLPAVCRAAKLFARRVRHAAKYGESADDRAIECMEKNGSSVKTNKYYPNVDPAYRKGYSRSSTVDDFQRIRMIRDTKIRP